MSRIKFPITLLILLVYLAGCAGQRPLDTPTSPAETPTASLKVVTETSTPFASSTPLVPTETSTPQPSPTIEASSTVDNNRIYDWSDPFAKAEALGKCEPAQKGWVNGGGITNAGGKNLEDLIQSALKSDNPFFADKNATKNAVFFVSRQSPQSKDIVLGQFVMMDNFDGKSFDSKSGVVVCNGPDGKMVITNVKNFSWKYEDLFPPK